MNALETDPPLPLQEALSLLSQAREILEEESARADQIGRVTVHLIDCVIEVSNLLAKNPDLDTARAALGSARSAVVAATYAVRHVHDRVKTTTEPPRVWWRLEHV